MTSFRGLVIGALVSAAAIAVLLPGCGDDAASNDPNFGNFGPGDGGGGGSGEKPLCLVNSCRTDANCAGCPGSKTTCNKDEKRCVACGALAGGKTCPSGQYCTQFGDCVPNGVTCGADPTNPSISCKSNADCAACDPTHKVCDDASKKCVGCLPNDLTNCTGAEVCVLGPAGYACNPKCPAVCKSDADCGACGAPGKEARVCNRGVCAQCSKDKPCGSGTSCDLEHGVCGKICGLPNNPAGTCASDADCGGCEGTTKCKLAVNGGKGTCAAPAAGCEDIAKGVFVLPDPFGRYTQLCSNDTNCASVSLDYNVGKTLRDLTGLSLIKDANIKYPMHACASVELLDKSCGVCVPCKSDPDCTPIDIDKVAGDMFGPLGSIGAALLLDKVFGASDHKMHMYCKKFGATYGACLPCSNPLARCGTTTTATLPSLPCPGATGMHTECQEGKPLGAACNSCTAAICAVDPWCCTIEWDFACREKVDLACSKGAQPKTCTPVSCSNKPKGWYCNENDPKLGAYLCDGATTTVISSSAACKTAGKSCVRKDPTDIRSNAVMVSETIPYEPQCN